MSIMASMKRFFTAFFIVIYSMKFFTCAYDTKRDILDVKLSISRDNVEIDNGIVKLTLSNPYGGVIGIQYANILNMLDPHIDSRRRGYWDVNWKDPKHSVNTSTQPIPDMIRCREMKVITNTSEQVEVSFVRKWSSQHSQKSNMPLNFDIRYILQKGKGGFYSYGVFTKPIGFPDSELVQARIVFRLNRKRFTHIRMSNKKGRLMPTLEDIGNRRSKPLAFKEAVRIVSPTDPSFVNEVDDKYQYSEENYKASVYGWHTPDASIGFWVIFPSQEFRNGGPTKQDLTMHTGPHCLVMFHSGHYMSNSSCIFNQDEEWEKVFGPVYVHLNHMDEINNDPMLLWNDAKQQRLIEMKSWPYSFVGSTKFVKSEERSIVYGQFLIYDSYMSSSLCPGKFAYIGLLNTNEKPSWQLEAKGYQFWGKTNQNGFFYIKNVLPGTYWVWGWARGILGEYRRNEVLVVYPGTLNKVGQIVFVPPRNGATLWEIGVPDRTAREYFIPRPQPHLINKMFLRMQRFRQYGLWDRYSEMYPLTDLAFKVGTSNYKKDWFYAHVTRKHSFGGYIPSIWQIEFDLNCVNKNSSYMLRIAIASSNYAHLEVNFNNPPNPLPHFEATLNGKDSAIARHGVHGVYQLLNVQVNPSWLLNGTNVIYLTQRNIGVFSGLMYDYIRMEGNDS